MYIPIPLIFSGKLRSGLNEVSLGKNVLHMAKILITSTGKVNISLREAENFKLTCKNRAYTGGEIIIYQLQSIAVN